MDDREAGRASVPRDGGSAERGERRAHSQAGRIQLRRSRPHAEGQAPGARTSPEEKALERVKKRALQPGAGDRLCFGDEAGFNRYPSLARRGHRQGQPPRVRTPGKNRKQDVFGAIDSKSWKFFYPVQDTNNPFGCMVIAQQLVAGARSLATPVILGWDNSRTHTAKRLEADLDQPEVRRWLKIFWRSTYSPDRNDLERRWKYLKPTGVANHRFGSVHEFRSPLLKLLATVNKDADRVTAIPFKGSRRAA